MHLGQYVNTDVKSCPPLFTDPITGAIQTPVNEYEEQNYSIKGNLHAFTSLFQQPYEK